MPSIRILTWNSTGESFPKAASLAAEAATHAAHATHPVIDIYLIQEAQQGAGGAIGNYLTGLAGYTVHHIHENLGGGGKGYICATRNASVTVSTPCTLELCSRSGIHGLGRPYCLTGIQLDATCQNTRL